MRNVPFRLAHALRDHAPEADDLDLLRTRAPGGRRRTTRGTRGARFAARQCGSQVLAGDAPTRTGASDLGEIDARLACASPRRWRGHHATARRGRRRKRPRAVTVAPGGCSGRRRSRSRRLRCRRCQRRWGRRERLRFQAVTAAAGSAADGAAASAPASVSNTIRSDPTLTISPGAPCKRKHTASDGSRHLDRCLVGHDLGHELVFLDEIADLDVPGDDLRLDRSFARGRAS